MTSLTKDDLGIASTEEYFEVMDLARKNTGKEPFDPQRDVIKPFGTIVNRKSPVRKH
ncbi:hypothetical protein SFC43_25190 [Bacteroides sp. CR5/BHMF/2]|nr:hypothetical protein [Bacteroides sp. CR5/BHMF/2]